MTHQVFVSRPTVLTTSQQRFLSALEGVFAKHGLKCHTVGAQDFTNRSPWVKVLEVMNTCDGACILGLVQMRAANVVLKPGTRAKVSVNNAVFASPWNQLEAGMALITGLPLFVVCEAGVSGGIFDPGTGDAFIHRLPAKDRDRWLENDGFVGSLKAWIAMMDDHVPRKQRG